MVTTYSYDDAGELCWTVTGSSVNTNTCASPPAGATVYRYDPAGRMLTATGAGGNFTSYGHDPAGRLQSLYLVAGTYDTTQTRTYSPGGDVVSTTNTGTSTTSAYGWDDAAGVSTLASLSAGGTSTDLGGRAGRWVNG